MNVSCNHNNSNMFYLLWYQQTEERELHLIGHIYSTKYNPETEFEKRFKMSGNANSHGFMEISHLTQNDSGVYFCAVREAQCSRSPLAPYKNPKQSHFMWGSI